MAEIFTHLDRAALEAAGEALARGDLVVIPTDTVYGVACRPDFPAATTAIFQAKQRPRGLTLPVLAATVEDAQSVARLDHRARRLAERFWPGPLTLVLPRTDRSAGWDLGEERRTVAVRVPDHADALALLRGTGPLAVTSANRSGRPPAETCEGARAELGDSVAVYLCAGRAGGVPSTVADVSAGEVAILRRGALEAERIRAALAGP